MSDTNINGYFMAVDEARTEVVAANAKLAAAKDALELKKQQVGYVDPEPESKPQDTTPDPAPNTGGVFRKK